jgi:alkylation response protein AidB-like acyl-CoA dehydrogenase
MDLCLPPHAEDLQRRFRQLAVAFAERAVAYDRAGEFPARNFADLRASGLLGLTIPRELGGLGADYLSFALAVEEIARACASTSLCFVMHCACVDFLSAASPEDQARYFRTILERGALWTVVFSETGSGAQFLRPGMTARRVDGGYVVNGVKAFATSAGAADYVIFNALVEGEPADRFSVFVVAPKRNPGVTVQGTWDSLGMRANDSRSLRFTDCLIPEEDRLGPEGEGAAVSLARPSHVPIGLAATSVGIAQAALDAAREHARTRTIAGSSRPISRYQSIRFAIAEMATTVDSIRLMVHRAAWYADHRPSEAVIPIEQAKLLANAGSFEVANKAMQIVGGRGYLKGHPVERYLRDARAGALMATTAEQSRDLVGKLLLGIDPAEPD